nr:hypothetical protein [Tanacetum cinerariifolium]
ARKRLVPKLSGVRTKLYGVVAKLCGVVAKGGDRGVVCLILKRTIRQWYFCIPPRVNGRSRRTAKYDVSFINVKMDHSASKCKVFFLVLWPLDYRSASFGIKSQVVQMVGRGRPPRNARRTTDRGSDVEQRDPRDIEIEYRTRVTGMMKRTLLADWLSTVERIFDIRDVPEKLKVKLVAIKLRKSASLWWDHVKNQRVKDGKSKVETWAKMKKLLRDFIAEFDRLRMRCDVDEEEEQVIAWFLGALQPHFADVVYLQQYFTYEDVCRLALKVEKQQKNRVRTTKSRVTNPSRLPPVANSKKPSFSQQADFRIGTTANSTNSRVLRCCECQGLGHVVRECLNKQMVTIVDTPVYDTENNEDVVQDINELVYADQGEALVTQRVLNVAVAETGDDTSWLRNNIFRTKCTTKGKVCTVIIDGGSCDNMVAKSMVEKVGLDVQDHP